MTSDEIIGFKKSSKINGLKLDETCRTPNSYFKRRVLIFCELIVNFFSCSNIPYFQNPLGQLETIWHLLISLTLLVHNHDHTCIGFLQ